MKQGSDGERLGAEQLIAEVLEALRRSRAYLLDPDAQNIDCCRMVMAQCAEQMASLPGEAGHAPRPGNTYVTSLRLVRSELAAMGRLLDAAAALRRDILRAIATAIPAGVKPIEAMEEKVRHVHVLG